MSFARESPSAARTDPNARTAAAAEPACPPGPRVDFAGAATLHGLVAAQVERTPDAVAVTFEGRSLTYRGLDRLARRIARHLVEEGAGPEARVGVMVERSLELVAALLGVLQAGAAFVPLDPGYPDQRLEFMLADAAGSEPPLVLVQERLLGRLPAPARSAGARVIVVDRAEGAAGEAGPPLPRVTGGAAAYVLYTSGSTGRPKGAVNTHRAIRNRLLWMQEQYRLGAGDRVLQKTPYSFDVSVWELFWPLLAGACLVVARPDGHKDSAYLVDTIVREGITTLHFVPSMLHAFLADPEVGRCTGLRRVIASGEALTADLEARFLERLPAELHNLYGPTEAAIDVTHWPCRRGDDRPAPRAQTVPIGWAIANVTMRVLGRDLEPLPRGAEGELYIGGAGLARGYHARPGLTAERFLPDPLAGDPSSEGPGARLYRTGDLGRALPDGSLEFLGRVDFQVKLRGQRIELGEIEAVLGGHPAVREVAVGVHGAGDFDQRLVAWAVPDAASALPLRRRLELERTGELEAPLLELPDGMEVAYRNRPETEFVWREIFEEEVYLRHGVTLEDGDAVVDVGANIGLFTLFATGRGARVSVLAFEPIPQLAALARLNAELYGAAARVIAAGVAARPGRAEFTYYPHVSLISGRHADPEAERAAVRAFVVGQLDPAVRAALGEGELDALLAERLASERVTCPLTTISAALAEHGIERVDLLKVDAEKSELEVLEGIAAADWPKIRQVVAEVHDLDGRLERARGLLLAHGFEVAVERDASLAGSRLFNLYAVRPEARRAVSGAASGDPRRRWSSARRLAEDLRRHCAERLPEPWVPGQVVLLPAMPLTPSGKTDRRALPEPPRERAQLGIDYRAPRTRVERELAALWSELLAIERVGIDDDLLALGGHSLLAAQLSARLRSTLGVTLPPVEVFRHPTVAALAARIEQRSGDASGRPAGAATVPPPLVRWPRPERIPITFPQEQIWLIHQLAPGNIAYNFQYTIRFRGPLERRVLERALTEIVRRHEVLRTTFEADGGEASQSVHSPWAARTPVVDLAALPAKRREAVAERLVHRRVRRSFDLARLPLVEWTLLRLGAGDHVFVHAEHHFVHDGWALAVFLRELRALYSAYAAGRPSPLPELPVQFADFALWQRRWMSGAALAAQLDYWRRQIAGAPGAPELPADRPRPRELSFRGARFDADLPPALYERLRAFGRQERATLFMVMTAAFEALVARISGDDDFLLGSGVANRRLEESEPLIGMIVNTLVLRADVTGDPTFRELLERVRESTLGMQEHQDLPFERLVAAVQPERDLSRNPLFQHLFSFHDAPVPDLDFAGLAGELVERHNGSAKSDLNVVVKPRAEQRIGRAASAEDAQLRMLWEYATDLYDATTVERLWGHYQVLLAGVLAGPERRVSELPLLSAAERQQLVEWQTAPAPGDAAVPVHRLVEAWAARAPEAPALVAGDRRLTYGELDRRADLLASRLRGFGIGPEAVVGVCLEPGPELVTALLAVLKAGGAYLPLDPAHPEERLAYTLADAAAPVLVTRERLLPRLSGFAGRVLAIDAAEPAGGDRDAGPADIPAASTLPGQLAYVIYTSGSTGRPKGASLTHAGLANLVAWHRRAYRVAPDERATQVASPAFDASVWEIWPYLAAGAAVHFPPAEVRAEPERLYRWLAEEKITLAFLPTPLAEAMLDGEPPDGLALRALLVGGDRLHRAPEPGLPFALVNHYGPTESTVVATAATVAPAAANGTGRPAPAPAIGRPIDGLCALVLDPRMRPLPAGAAGQLWIGGAGLARGYLHRPALTADRFRPDPFAGAGAAGSRLYASGDLVRHRAGGALEFLGRTDRQVKIRGFRIEPGEIEALLEAHPAVRRAAVVADPAGTRLAGFLVAVPGDPPDTAQIAAWLRTRLPESMLPASLELLDELPLAPTGKIDRRRLTERAEQAGRAPAAAPEPGREAPPTPTEEVTAAIWSQVLDLPSGLTLGPSNGFFELGGHSLAASRAAARLREAFGIDLPLSELFAHPRLGALAAAIDRRLRTGGGPGEEGPRPLPRAPEGPTDLPQSFAQVRLWFLDRLLPRASAYHIARVYSLRGELAPAALAAAARALVARHEALRTGLMEAPGEGEPGAVGGDEPLQRVLPPAAASHLRLPAIDLAALPSGARAAETGRLRAAETERRFDLAAGMLLRLTLLRLAPGEHRLLLTLHHAIADGWSMAILGRELSALYRLALGPDAAPLPPLPVQYADYAVWQRRRLAGESLAREVRGWVESLGDLPEPLDLPADRPRPKTQSYRGGDRVLVLPPRLGGALQALARREGATLFMVLTAAYAILLGRHAGSRRLVIGTPVANRARPELEGLIGPFVNMLAIPVEPAPEATFRGLLGAVRRRMLWAHAHEELPFEKLVEVLEPERDLSREPVFQVVLALQNTPAGELELSGVEIAGVEIPGGRAKFDLTLAAEERPDGALALNLNFAADLFDPATAGRLLRRFAVLLEAAAAGPERRVSELPLLSAAERQQLVEWRTAPAPGDAAVPVHRLVEAWAARAPEAPALVAGDRRLTYGELDRRADLLASRLRGFGIGPEAVVGVCLEPGPELVTALLAVLKAGGAYLPLDPAHPEERLAYTLADAAAPVLVTQERLLPRLSGFAGRVLAIDAAEPAGGDCAAAPADGLPPAATLPASTLPGQLAYVIYTSGSTGRPKGASLTHAGLANLVAWHRRAYRVAPDERATQVASPAFDASVWEIWPYLAAGAAVHFPPGEVRAEPERLYRWLAEEKITLAFLPTPLAEAMLDGEPPDGLALRALLVGGDRLHRAPDPGLPFALVNHYGPTESTVVATAATVAPAAANGTGRPAPAPAIGRPIDGLCALVLDPRMRPLPAGAAGQLWIGGAGLARGYLHRPALTADRFRPDPFAAAGAAGSRLYSSGDLVRHRAGGALEFLGRTDRQVKIRGFRIEPGEIEALLEAHPAVRRAAVVADPSDTRLAGFLVAAPGAPPDTAEIAGWLRTRLPESMLPASLELLDELPLAPTGKIDRQRLAERAEQIGRAPAAGGDGIVAPRTDLERRVAAVWAEVLRVERVGVEQSFFALGGHSLLATRVLSRLRRDLGAEIGLRAFFEQPTVAGLARAIGDATGPAAPPAIGRIARIARRSHR